MCEICSKLAIKTLEQQHGRRSGVFNLTKPILRIVLEFPLLECG